MYLGRLSGIPLHVHSTVVALFVAFLGWCAYSFGLRGIPAGALLAAQIFAAVVLHELGHALAARTFGIATAHITLYPFGGAAALEREARSAHEELVIAAAGPAVNGGLFVVSGLLWGVVGWRSFLVFSALNLLMMAYNLLPAYPMDGGRILRALLARRMGWFAASRTAMQVGRVFAWGFIGLGIVFRSITSVLTGVMLLGALRMEHKRIAWLWAYEREAAGYTDTA